MKIDRLIGILAVLQTRGTITAPMLAEKFEVSRRTINRDIEDLCRAGFPIVTMQGAAGGIALMEGFSLDTTLFTPDELQSILIGLQSLDSVSHTAQARTLANKLAPRRPGALTLADHVLIDLSSHYKDSLAPKIEAIRQAIGQRRTLAFNYYSAKGEERKTIEPYFVVFKWSSWYVFGYCPARTDFRLYKLNRLWDLTDGGETFSPRHVPEEALDFDRCLPDDQALTALFEPSEKYLLIESYGRDCFTTAPDGRLLFQRGYTNFEPTLRWLLGFGDRVEVVGPPALRAELLLRAEAIARKYR